MPSPWSPSTSSLGSKGERTSTASHFVETSNDTLATRIAKSFRCGTPLLAFIIGTTVGGAVGLLADSKSDLSAPTSDTAPVVGPVTFVTGQVGKYCLGVCAGGNCRDMEVAESAIGVPAFTTAAPFVFNITIDVAACVDPSLSRLDPDFLNLPPGQPAVVRPPALPAAPRVLAQAACGPLHRACTGADAPASSPAASACPHDANIDCPTTFPGLVCCEPNECRANHSLVPCGARGLRSVHAGLESAQAQAQAQTQAQIAQVQAPACCALSRPLVREAGCGQLHRDCTVLSGRVENRRAQYTCTCQRAD